MAQEKNIWKGKRASHLSGKVSPEREGREDCSRKGLSGEGSSKGRNDFRAWKTYPRLQKRKEGRTELQLTVRATDVARCAQRFLK